MYPYGMHQHRLFVEGGSDNTCDAKLEKLRTLARKWVETDDKRPKDTIAAHQKKVLGDDKENSVAEHRDIRQCEIAVCAKLSTRTGMKIFMTRCVIFCSIIAAISISVLFVAPHSPVKSTKAREIAGTEKTFMRNKGNTLENYTSPITKSVTAPLSVDKSTGEIPDTITQSHEESVQAIVGLNFTDTKFGKSEDAALGMEILEDGIKMETIEEKEDKMIMSILFDSDMDKAHDTKDTSSSTTRDGLFRVLQNLLKEASVTSLSFHEKGAHAS